jgi:hypothetical protein
MSTDSQRELPDVPDVKSIPNHMVLATYGQTMQYAQEFENTLKLILRLHNALEGLGKGPVDDKAFQAILEGESRSTLGQVLRKVRQHLGDAGTPFPDYVDTTLDSVVQCRNSMAHSYLMDRRLLMSMPEAGETLIAELRHNSQTFLALTKVFEKWVDLLMARAGFTKEEMGEYAVEISEIAKNVRPKALAKLQEHLKNLGAM